MHVDALNALAADVASGAVAPVYHEALASSLARLVGKHSPEKAGSDNKVIVFFHSNKCFLCASMLPPVLRRAPFSAFSACRLSF